MAANPPDFTVTFTEAERDLIEAILWREYFYCDRCKQQPCEQHRSSQKKCDQCRQAHCRDHVDDARHVTAWHKMFRRSD